jgi:hypothetical protein
MHGSKYPAAMGTLSWPTAFGLAGIALYVGPAATGKWLQSKFRR